MVGVLAPDTPTPSLDAKLKHLEFIQATIARMSTNSALFKGWAITVASGLGAFAALEVRIEVLAVAIATTAMFWGLDGYYLWLERGFVALHRKVAATDPREIDFSMTIAKDDAFKAWLCTCVRRPHLLVFYLVMIFADIAGIVIIAAS